MLTVSHVCRLYAVTPIHADTAELVIRALLQNSVRLRCNPLPLSGGSWREASAALVCL